MSGATLVGSLREGMGVGDYGRRVRVEATEIMGAAQ